MIYELINFAKKDTLWMKIIAGIPSVARVYSRHRRVVGHPTNEL